MHRRTIALYEREAETYRRRRHADDADRTGVVTSAARGGRVLDAGCGPGIYLPALGPGVVGLDAAMAMLRLSRRAVPAAPLVRGDLARLPFCRGAFAAVWARQSYLHLAKAELPLALADLHRCLRPNAALEMAMLEGPGDAWSPPNDDLPGRFFAGWRVEELVDVLEGAGFADVTITEDRHKLWCTATRSRTIPDTVGLGMGLLLCGLNPSLHAADAGVAYAGPGNRFWPAAIESGIVTRPRDPWTAVTEGVGMTDLVKRATPRAGDVTRDEYRAGSLRVRRLVAWLQPRALCFVGLAGYRVGIDAHAVPGWQPENFEGVATYIMPSTSALNAATRYADLLAHFHALRSAMT